MSVDCALGGGNYYIDGDHFDPDPTTTFFDPIDSLVSTCGDLTFDDRTRSLTTIYGSGAQAAEENPWKYWWWRARSHQGGATDSLAEVRKVSKQPGIPDTATVAMWLSQEYDALGVVLILDSNSTLVPTEVAFTEPGPPPGYPGMNLTVQHWRHIDPPILDSVALSGSSNATLFWTNRNQGRSIDSTNVYRDGVWRATLGSAVTAFVDSNLTVGPHTYTLKHVSTPATGFSNLPNSAASNAVQVTVQPPPPPLDVAISGTDLIMQNGYYTWQTVVSGGYLPYGPYRWDYRVHGTSTWTPVGTQPSYTRYVRTTDNWFWLRATVYDDHGDSANARIAVETWNGGGAAAPAGPTGQIGVRLPDGTCSPRPPVGDPGRQAWLQMIMEAVTRIEYCRVEARTP